MKGHLAIGVQTSCFPPPSLEHVDLARRQLTPELVPDGVFAGSVEKVLDEVRPYTGAGLRHLVVWQIGLVSSGGSAGDLVRFARLIWGLRKLELP